MEHLAFKIKRPSFSVGIDLDLGLERPGLPTENSIPVKSKVLLHMNSERLPNTIPYIPIFIGIKILELESTRKAIHSIRYYKSGTGNIKHCIRLAFI